jgi:hypothetical protein
LRYFDTAAKARGDRFDDVFKERSEKMLFQEISGSQFGQEISKNISGAWGNLL